jgi:hypothetical protein
MNKILKYFFVIILVVSIFLDVYPGSYIESWMYSPLGDSVLIFDNWKTTISVEEQGGISVPNFRGLSVDGLILIFKLLNSVLIFMLTIFVFIPRVLKSRLAWSIIIAIFLFLNIAMVMNKVISLTMFGSLVYYLAASSLFYLTYPRVGHRLVKAPNK